MTLLDKDTSGCTEDDIFSSTFGLEGMVPFGSALDDPPSSRFSASL
jgi:hypothetical protein